MQAIRHEAFTHMEGQKEFVQIDSNDLFPYLLVNIGSGVSMIKVICLYHPHLFFLFRSFFFIFLCSLFYEGESLDIAYL